MVPSFIASHILSIIRWRSTVRISSWTHSSPGLLKDTTLINTPVLLNRVDVLDHPFCPIIARRHPNQMSTISVGRLLNKDLLITRQSITMNLHSRRILGCVRRSDLVKPQQISGRIIQFVMVDLVRGKGGVERYLDVGSEGDVLHVGDRS